jgi:hypothetical protein
MSKIYRNRKTGSLFILDKAVDLAKNKSGWVLTDLKTKREYSNGRIFLDSELRDVVNKSFEFMFRVKSDDFNVRLTGEEARVLLGFLQNPSSTVSCDLVPLVADLIAKCKHLSDLQPPTGQSVDSGASK